MLNPEIEICALRFCFVQMFFALGFLGDLTWTFYLSALQAHTWQDSVIMVLE